jgi:hypothetical protein
MEAGEDKLPSFRINAYNGDALQVNGFKYPVVIELKSAKFEDLEQTYINRHHDQTRELGHTTARHIDAEGIFVEGVFSHDNRDTQEIVEASRRGKQFKASIEASFPPATFYKRGRSVSVNDRRISGPVYVARNAVITGVAILTRAADMSSEVKIAAKEQCNMDSNLKSYIEQSGFVPEDLSDEQIAFLSEKFNSEQLSEVKDEVKMSSKVNDMDWHEIRRKASEEQAAHAEYRSDIRRICAQYGEPDMTLPDGSVITLEAHALRNEMPVREVELQARLHQAECKTGLNAGAGTFAVHDASQHDDDAKVIECAMGIHSRGFTESDIQANAWYDEKTVNLALDKRYRGYRPSRLAQQVFAKAGVYHPSGQFDDEYIANMVRATNKLEAAQGFTTISIPRILSNVQNKTLLAAYNRAPSMVPFCFGQASTNDFKPMYTYQLEGSTMLEQVGADGEVKHGKVVESEYTKQLETYAQMLAWTRKMILNDDLSALSRTSQMLGVASFKAREYAATQFLANSTLFSVGNGNLLTGNSLNIDGLTASGVAFDGQTDFDGLPISVDGPRILAPASLKVITAQLQNQTEIRDNATGKVFINNPHAGNFTSFNSQWIENAVANPTVDADKTWYRFADPAQTPAFEVVYLNGNDSPTISSEPTAFNTVGGMQFKAIFDFGFGEADFRYAQKNVGV